jgi:uncharacterized protein
MPGKKRSLLDSFALVAFLSGEPPGGAVRDLLHAAEAAEDAILMNEINVGEVYYLTARRRSQPAADAFLEMLSGLPIERVPNTFADVIAAARLKASFAISYADAFAAATAVRRGAVIVTGDPDFRALETVVEIRWI